MPTPAIAYLTRTFRACAGIVISASHNPYHDNGIKFFSDSGEKLDDAIEQEIEQWLDKPMDCVPAEDLGKVRRLADARGRYIEFCKSRVPDHFRLNGWKIVVDCAHGATYHIAPSVFEELGADVIPMGIEPDGFNINDGVGSTSPEAMQQAVVEHQADLGIAFDGDGDRVMMADRSGRLYDGDALLFVLAKHGHQSGQLSGGVVGTLMSNLGLELALRQWQVPFVRTKVGDRYVMEALKQEGWLLGGESSGHLICRAATTTGDGLVASLRVLYALSELGATLEEATRDYEMLPQVLRNVPVGQRFDPLSAEAVVAAVRSAEERLGGSGRVLLRASGTEPLIRVMVEGRDSGLIHQLAEELAQVVAAHAPG
jgi:phosphoglucosamine mutase